ncbi:DUF937 domain-containing protein [Vibrio sp. RC27]
MNILSTLLQSGLDENLISSIAEKTGIDAGSLPSLISEVAPQLLEGAKANLAGEGDSSDLISMISNTSLDDVVSNPSSLLDMDTSGMIGQLFSSGNQDEVVNAMSEKSGFDASSISALLPMLAPVVMGALNKQTNLGDTDTSDTNGVTSMLTNMLDQDGDGSVADDLLGMAKKFF